MQKASRIPAQVCKADKAEVTENNDIVLTQKWKLKNSQIKRTLDIEGPWKRPPKNPVRTPNKGCDCGK